MNKAKGAAEETKDSIGRRVKGSSLHAEAI